MASPGEALEAALNRYYGGVAVTLTDAVTQFGGNSGLAQAIAGTTDKRDKAYKAALRNVQRYQAGAGKQQRTFNLAHRVGARVQQAVGARQLRRSGVTATAANVHVKISDTSGTRSPGAQELTGNELGEALDLLDAGDPDAAGDVFAKAFTDAYGGANEQFVNMAEIDEFDGLTFGH